MNQLRVMIKHEQTQPGGDTVDATQILRETSHLSLINFQQTVRPPSNSRSVDSQTNMKTEPWTKDLLSVIC